MRGDSHAWSRRVGGTIVAGGMLLAAVPSAPVAAGAADADPARIPPCASVDARAATAIGIGARAGAGPEARTSADDGTVVQPWRDILDEDGVVIGYEMTLRRQGTDVPLRTGPRGFAVPLERGRLLLGERSDEGTRLLMLDVARGCRLWTRQLDQLAYPRDGSPGGRGVRFGLHEPVTRLYEGTLEFDLESGASGGMIDGECITDCQPNDGDVTPAAYRPTGPARPVPSFPAGGWPVDKQLPFRWAGGEHPPTWAKDPLRAAADDARSTSAARSPHFPFDADADDSVRYTGLFPTYCRTGIACAARAMPTFWAVWLRPHGTDFSWGTLRWCQKDAGSGCFDIRRVMLHELGHIAGLNHPSADGPPLQPHETVMHAIAPAKPATGSTRHAFGRCDVATLQELYDVPDNRTPISTCNDVETRLDLSASASSIDAGRSVTLTAELRIAARDAYGRLAGNPLNGRSVKLRYRPAGSDAGWSTAWMRPLYASGRYEVVMSPSTSLEFMAAFPSPDDEGLRYSHSQSVVVKVKP